MEEYTQIPKEGETSPDEILPSERQPQTVMAIQEILGLFESKPELDEEQERHEYLKKKPLGLI